eukprot:GHUV01056061.1.p1 GENE.GHUV01056061.1~~GHUV01056061.1.p1  ORF type:complete len:248 (-),score=56.93 GHUV01056061.1:113-856(-)
MLHLSTYLSQVTGNADRAYLCTYSAVRDAAVECLEEVYRVYGEQLIDIINRHSLRPAHMNAIYARLQQLGADVTPTAAASTANEQSAVVSQQSRGRGGAAADDYDTATSAIEEASELSYSGPAAALAGHGARRQSQQQVAAEESVSSVLEPSRTLTSAGVAAKAKRGGYKVQYDPWISRWIAARQWWLMSAASVQCVHCQCIADSSLRLLSKTCSVPTSVITCHCFMVITCETLCCLLAAGWRWCRQ